MVFFLFLLLAPSSAAGETEKVVVTPTGGEEVVHPGMEATYFFRVENNATESDRYLLETALEFDWQTNVSSITYFSTGEPMGFTKAENGILTTEPLPAGEMITVELTVQVPILTTEEEHNQNLGLMEDTNATISLWVSAMSDDFTSKDIGKFEARVSPYHTVVIKAVPDSLSVTTVGKESERVAEYAIKASYLSNDMKGDHFRLSITRGISQLWKASLSESVFNATEPGMIFYSTLYVVAPVGQEWAPEPWEVSVHGFVTSGNGTEITTKTHIRKTARVSVFTAHNSVRCDPGDTILHPISIQNLGNCEDFYSVTINSEGQSHWLITEKNFTDPVSPFGILEFQLRIHIPTKGAPPLGMIGNYTISVFSNLSSQEANDSQKINVEVGIRRNTSVSVIGMSSREIIPGKNVSFECIMTNTGNLPEKISAVFRSNVDFQGIQRKGREKDWDILIKNPEKYLGIGESHPFSIRITAPEDSLLYERLNLTLRAFPVNSVKEHIAFPGSNISVIVKKFTKINISSTRDYLTAAPNETIKHTLLIENLGNHKIKINNSDPSELTLNLTISREEDMEKWFWIPENFTVQPYSGSQVYLYTRLHKKILKDTTYLLTLKINGDYETTANITMKTSQTFGLRMYFTETSHKIPQGNSTNYTLVMHNLGNGMDTFDLSVLNEYEYWDVSLQNTSISLNPFSKKYLSIIVSSPSAEEYHGQRGEGARFLVRGETAELASEVYTPYTFISTIGVLPPTKTLESYYTFDPNLANDTSQVGTLTGYCYENKEIIYGISFMNLGEGNGTEFDIPEMFPPSYMNITIRTGRGVIIENNFTANNYSPLTLFLHVSVSEIKPPMEISDKPILFNINSDSGSNSIYILTKILRLDMFFRETKIPDEVVEGEKTNLRFLLNASTDSNRTSSGNIGVDYLRDIVLTGYYNGDKVFTRRISILRIGETLNITVSWKAPELAWNEKVLEEELLVEISDYKTYQGDVEIETGSNKMKRSIAVRDASIANQGELNILSSVVIIFGLLAIEYYILRRFTIALKRDKVPHAVLIPLFAVFFAVLNGAVFNLPWHLILGNNNTLGYGLTYFSLLLLFPGLLVIIAKTTRSYAVVQGCAVFIIPVYLLTMSIGAGMNAVESSFTESFLFSEFEIGVEILAVYLIPLYFILGRTINFRIKQTYSGVRKIIKGVRSDLSRNMKKARRKSYGQ